MKSLFRMYFWSTITGLGLWGMTIGTATQLASCPTAAQRVETHATPTATPAQINWTHLITNVDVSVLIDSKGQAFANPTEWTITTATVRLHCEHEPIVTKESDGRWLVTFKP